MITIDMEGRTKALYIRENRRVKWKYSQYGGRWRSADEALKVAEEHMGDKPYEYLIEDLDTGAVVTGFVNWNRRR